MRSSLTLGTRGKLSSRVKRTLVIASFGFIQVINTAAVAENAQRAQINDANFVHYTVEAPEVRDTKQVSDYNAEVDKKNIIDDDKEVLLIIKMFTQWL